MVIYSYAVFVRGIPVFGKPTLAELLHRHTLETCGYRKVHSFTWRHTDSPWFEYLNIQSGLACLTAEDCWASMKDTLIIIDEVQPSFNDIGLSSDLTKPMSKRPLKAEHRVEDWKECGEKPSTKASRCQGEVPIRRFKDFLYFSMANISSSDLLSLLGMIGIQCRRRQKMIICTRL